SIQAPMLPRTLAFLTIAFWLVMMGILFHREIWPELAPGEPPPYVADRVDEANILPRQGKRQAPLTGWNLYRVTQGVESKSFDRVSRIIEYFEGDDTFAFHVSFSELSHEHRSQELPRHYRIDKMDSTYHVTRQGRLVDFEVTTAYTHEADGASFQ